MRARQNGGVIGPTNVANSTVASGVYSIVEAQLDKQAGSFPQYTIPSEPQFYTNALLLHGDGSNLANNNVIIDSSTTAASITRNGTVTQGSFSPFNLNGWSNLFNGSADALTVAGSAAFAFGTGDFTIEFWMRSTSSATSMNLLWMTSSWAIIVYTNSQIYYQSAQAVTNVIAGVSYGTLMDGNWHHVALVRASGQSRFFIDGTPIGTATADTNNYTATNTVNIANLGGYGWFNGSMSNLRIVKGTALYNLNNTFTPSTTPLTAVAGTSLLTCQSYRFVDNSSNAYALTRVGTPITQAYQPFAPSTAYGVSTVGGGFYFGAGTDNLSVADNANLRLGTNTFTIEGWIYPTVSGATQTLADKGNGSVVSGWLARINTSNQLEFLDVSTAYAAASAVVQINAWNHFCFIRDASNNILIGLNGNLYSAAAGITRNYSQAEPFYVGVGRGGSANPYTGYMSNFRVLNGTALYSGSTYTVPSAPFAAGDAANTVLLLNGTNAGIYDTTGKNNLITGTSAGLSTTASKFGGSSMYFGGTAAYCIYTSPSTASLSPVNKPGDFGTADFTIEFWVNPSASGGYQCILTNRNSAGGAGTWFLGLYTGTTQVAWINAASTTLNSTALTAGTWNHVAVSRASGTIRMFINGALTGTSSAADTTNYNASGLISIGFDIVENTYGFTGYIDDIRISRYARYTSAFTAPTAAFLNQ